MDIPDIILIGCRGIIGENKKAAPEFPGPFFMLKCGEIYDIMLSVLWK